MKKITYTVLILLMLITISSCSTVNQSISLAEVQTDFPVSASKSIFNGSEVVTSSDFAQTEAFSTDLILKVPFLEKEQELDLTPYLQEEMAGGNFSGISELEISIDNIDNNTAYWIDIERQAGFYTAAAGVSGIFFYLTSLSIDMQMAGTDSLLLPSILCTGLGAGIFGLSYLHESLGTIDYYIGLDGVKVRY